MTNSSLNSSEIIGFVRDWVDENFSAECAFLTTMVQVRTDNPPGDCAAHAAVAAQRLEDLGLLGAAPSPAA
jgi:succinyl-diaminopimelate desuccinylase